MASIPQNIISHWHYLIENFNTSTQEFYAQLERAIEKREIPSIRMHRVHHSEGSVLSGKREYLRVRRHGQIFDICAAPFGTGFFISWWFGENQGCLTDFPILGIILSYVKPDTYYQVDTRLMFQESIRLAVLEVIDEVISTKGLKSLSETDRKPFTQHMNKG